MNKNLLSPIFLTDFYKTDHRRQYPVKTEKVYSNLTARGTRIPGIEGVVVFGVQAFVQEYLVNNFNKYFFDLKKEDVVGAYKRLMDNSLGKDSVTTEHLEALHDLGYLPVRIKALPEGTVAPLRVPVLTIVNTDDRFYWITNFLETLMSNALWHPITSATIAHEYRKMLNKYAAKTSDMPEFVGWQGHDFSMRGQASVEASVVSGAAHLLSFFGTDTIPALNYLETFYKANSDKELIGGSVPATEHSVMCMGGHESEYDTYKRLITEVYPKGIVSIVSDTWDYWKVLTETIPSLKSTIMARDGKVVVRPDSGDPVAIVCGDKNAPIGSPEFKGTIELLWETFGGTVNSKGYKQLDSHVGCIYGDSITLDHCNAICVELEAKGFASTNMVFGIGSYTYQYVTRDTFGFAVKATWGQIDGKPIDIYKAPKTDNGLKNSARGRLRVNDDLTLSECVTEAEEKEGLLQTVFENGKVMNVQSLSEIRVRLEKK